MGTKNNPGAFDCYEKAEPDEPMFVLLARDPRAAHMTELWAALEEGGIYEAVKIFNDMVQENLYGPSDDVPQKTQAKVKEAEACAQAMRDWRHSNGHD